MDENLKKIYDSLSDEAKEKLKDCKNAEELQKVLEENGIELNPELLKAVSGGFMDPGPDGPFDPKCISVFY